MIKKREGPCNTLSGATHLSPPFSFFFSSHDTLSLVSLSQLSHLISLFFVLSHTLTTAMHHFLLLATIRVSPFSPPPSRKVSFFDLFLHHLSPSLEADLFLSLSLSLVISVLLCFGGG